MDINQHLTYTSHSPPPPLPSLWIKWLRILIPLGIPLAAIALTYIAVRFDPLYALIISTIPFLVLSFEWISQRSYFYPTIILLISSITAFYVSKGITPALILTAAFTVLWIINQTASNRRVNFVPSAVNIPVFAWIFICLLSLVWGWLMADPFLITWQGIEIVQLAQLAVFILSPVAMILTANLLTEEKHLKWMVICYLLVTTYGILAEVLSLPFRLNLRGLNSTWVVGILYGLLLFKPDLSRWWKLTFLFIIGLFLFRFFYMGITWLSGWLPIIVMIVVITFLRSRKALMIMLILGMVAVVVFLPWLQNQFAAEYTESGGNRLEKWIFLFQQPFVWNHVLLGTGPFGYARYFMTYFPENAASTHSNYIDIFLQTGVVGSFIFSFLLVALAWEWWKIYRVSIRSTFLRSYHITAMGGLIAILVAMSLGDWFTPFVLNQGLHGFSWTVQNWIFLGGLLALPKILKNMQTAPTAKMQ